MYARLSAGTAAPTATSRRLASSGGEHGARGAAQPGRQAPRIPACGRRGGSRRRARGQHDAGEAGVELVRVTNRRPLAGSLMCTPRRPKRRHRPVVHDVVVELPEEDGRCPHLGERRRFHLHALGLSARNCGRPSGRCWPASRRGRRRRRCAVPPAARAAVVAEHHGQRGGAALHGLHLEHGGGAYGLGLLALRYRPRPRTSPAARCVVRPVPAAAGRRELRRGGRGVRSGHGSSQSIGRWSARWMAPVARVMMMV